MRYKQITSIIKRLKPKSIVEVGVFRGDRAVEMSRAALTQNSKVHYTGYDLFEDMTNSIAEAEFHVKGDCWKSKVHARLSVIKKNNPEYTFELIAGNTKDTIKEYAADFVFLDGGHSVDTIASDYFRLRYSKVIILDDFYLPDDQGRCPDLTKVGCNKLLEGKSYKLLPGKDPIKGGGYVSMAIIEN